jgi:hypothetical protein
MVQTSNMQGREKNTYRNMVAKQHGKQKSENKEALEHNIKVDPTEGNISRLRTVGERYVSASGSRLVPDLRTGGVEPSGSTSRKLFINITRWFCCP